VRQQYWPGLVIAGGAGDGVELAVVLVELPAMLAERVAELVRRRAGDRPSVPAASSSGALKSTDDLEGPRVSAWSGAPRGMRSRQW
jgi:hypothetical protein